jgi:hypothetical protein
MSLLRPSNWPIFAGTALAIEAVDAKRAAAAEVLTVATIRHSSVLSRKSVYIISVAAYNGERGDG